MANHFSALKRARQTTKRTARNRANASQLRTALRNMRESLEKGGRLFPGSHAYSAERCAVAMHWPGCGQSVSLSDGRVSAPKNDLPCGLITFACPRST